jgi:uncharacterized protein YndB with AHSA1/START domain
MVDILHRVGIGAKPEKVFEALTTIQGLADWWTTGTKGEAGKGGTIDFGFNKMHVVAADPGKLVHWKCIDGPPEWIGTEVTFRLEWKLDQTFVHFKHAGWKDPVEFMHHCSTKWAVFLFSLLELVERGSGRPAPHDFKIHVGD